MADKLFDLEGRVALVTGSSGGLGRVLAEGLARNGVTVIINGRQVKKVEAVVDSLKGKGYDAVPSPFDVTRPVEIQKAAEQINALYGPPDIVINNAGLNLRHPLEEFPEEDWDTILNTNLKSAYLVSRVFVKPMIRNHQYLFTSERAGPENHCSLRRIKRGPEDAHKGNGCRMGRI